MMNDSGPVFLYLHGFASSPASTKAKAFVAWAARHGVPMDVLDLRVPSFERLLFSAIKQRVREAIDEHGGERARVALIGSSLGGLTACRVAEEDARVCAVFAMAPAFSIASRWEARIGKPAFDEWRRTGWIEVDSFSSGETLFPQTPATKQKHASISASSKSSERSTLRAAGLSPTSAFRRASSTGAATTSWTSISRASGRRENATSV